LSIAALVLLAFSAAGLAPQAQARARACGSLSYRFERAHLTGKVTANRGMTCHTARAVLRHAVGVSGGVMRGIDLPARSGWVCRAGLSRGNRPGPFYAVVCNQGADLAPTRPQARLGYN